MITFNEWATILPKDINGFQVIKIEKGFFKNIEYTYGSVAFEEGVDDITLKFEYNIKDGYLDPVHEDAFKKLTGDLLCAIMTFQLDNNEVIYSNGTDSE